MTSPDGPGPPPPSTAAAALSRSYETQRAIDRVYAIAMIMRLGFVMNLAAYLIAAMLTASELLSEHGPRTPEEMLGLLGGVGLWLVLAGANGAGIFGTYQMEHVRRRPFAIAAALLMLVPCISPCWMLSIPLGIWALIRLRQIPFDEWT
ncbi:MAG: hypothetical protein IRZ16_13080 [Myxococcaceae bacterium]|nr:hypothetical protein [Myxococcaceae bacterium]